MHVASLFDLSGTIALVTGGSRGLGLDAALELGRAGAAVAITGRREPWLTEAAATLAGNGVTADAFLCDVSQAGDVEDAVTRVLQRFGRIDILVNNAGISWGAPATELSLEKWHAVMATNAAGTFLMAQAVGREMIKAGRGSIINVASVVGLVGTAPDVLDAAGYAASKGAVISLTRDLAVKWAPHGIRVNAVAPGFFRTRMSATVIERAHTEIVRATPLGRIGASGELAGSIVFLASEAARYVTGHVLTVDGGMTAW